MKIAICFRGICRSLQTTITSIQENVINAAKKQADVKVFTHLYDLKEISNPRTKEFVKVNPDEYKMLQSDWTSIEQPNACFSLYPLNEIKMFGDEWHDEFKSFNNLIHALHSLKIGYEASLQWNPDIFIFARPDLLYHDSFEATLKNLIKKEESYIHIPLWQSFDGCNDRFAIINSRQLAGIYANRIDEALTYCETTQRSLGAEKFLFEHIKRNNSPISFIDIRASRVRANGAIKNEKFSLLRKSNINILRYYLRNRLKFF